MIPVRVRTTLLAFRRSFPRRGEFTLLPDESINAAVKRHDVPNAHGAYIIADSPAYGTIFYIGRAGTVTLDGKCKEQGLRGRLVNLQGRVRRAVAFRQIMSERQLPGLFFEWFVTFDETTKVLPAYAEARLLQAYFAEHGRLPELNKSV